MLDLHRLRLLRELKHRGTLAAVAEALAYTPSAISQQLSVLEAEAGVPLLERAGRRVRLTPAAERLVEHTEAILERLEQARADLDAGAPPRPLADLAGHPWILEPPGTAARDWATAVCRTAGFEPNVRYQSTDLFLHLRLVRTGHAVALLPGLLPADPAIHLTDLPGSPARRIYVATRRGASHQPALAAVSQALATAIQAGPPRDASSTG